MHAHLSYESLVIIKNINLGSKHMVFRNEDEIIPLKSNKM